MNQISCCMIVRDEESTLEACLQSVRPHVDELVIVDTGSVDETPEIAKRHADRFEVFLDCNDPETGAINDFAMARNRSLDIASGEWLFWIDGDDECRGGENLRKLADQAQADNFAWLLPYEYGHGPDGKCNHLQFRERLMRPLSKHRWQSPVHEVCLFSEPHDSPFVHEMSDLVTIVHRRGQSKKAVDPRRNLRILERHVEKVGEGDVRALYYLGIEYARVNDASGAFFFLQRYCDLTLNQDEKCCALLALSAMYRTVGDHNRAIEHAFKAMSTRSWPEPYWALAKSYYAFASTGWDAEYNYARARHFAELGLYLKPDDRPHNLLMQNPIERYEIHDILSVCRGALHDIDGAIASCEEGLKGVPPNTTMADRLASNLKNYKIERSKRTVRVNASELVKAGALEPAAATIIEQVLNGGFEVKLLETPVDLSLPNAGLTHPGDGQQSSDIASANARDLPLEGKLDIVLFVGRGLEPWNGRTFAQTGLGGSETMAWEMSRRLVKLGHRVRLYGHCTRQHEGFVDGVEFIDAARYRNIRCDVLITSRRPEAVDIEHNVKATAMILWVHDVHCGEALTMTRALRIDKVFCLSKWHAQFFQKCYPALDPEKVIITRNGIDLSRFDGSETRYPHRAIYSSSPDRGLETAVDIWPDVRKQFPHAELHVFYGWENWEGTAKAFGDEPQQKAIRALKHKCNATAGVVMRGRVNQKQLAREFMKASVWLYPTWFSETSCITAMEAQAAGCFIITSPVAALTETVARGAFIGSGLQDEWRSEEYMAACREKVCELFGVIEDHTRLTIPSELNRFSLDSLANEWDALLLSIHDEMKRTVIPKYKHIEPPMPAVKVA